MRQEARPRSVSHPARWVARSPPPSGAGQVPARFYPGVETLEHCSGLVIGDKLERRNRMESAPLWLR